MNKIISKISKNFLFIIIFGVAAILTIYTIVLAVNSKEGLASSNTNENNLTTEEIDKIVEDLKISGNIDNILEKLDDIIYRAQLSGNTALQEYATKMKEKYELQKQLDSVSSLIEAMKKKNSNIDSVDKQVTKILSVSTIIQDLQGAVSDECLLVLESLDDEKVKSLQEIMSEIENIVDLNDVSSL